jgi:hypothetical protein
MKKEEDDLIVYDEDKAVQFILEYVSSETKNKIGEDEINYVLDVVYEYYEDNGLLEEEAVEEASVDEEEMFQYVLKAAKKDKINVSEDDIQLILDGEFEFGKSLGIYEDEE